MPDEFDIYRSPMALPVIIGISLAWGLLASATCFVIIFISSFYIGGNLGPFGGILGGIFYAPIAFVLGTFLAGLCQIRRVTALTTWGGVGYALFLGLALLLFLMFLLFPSSVPMLIFGG